ncbi:hypothetical protein [Leifsonia sp. NPDC058248]|uniref:hypothetical protein n=1 Tax=Leifsonia sp. NPDC058248 TaxID=3346402 RepID=UPI0036D946FD
MVKRLGLGGGRAALAATLLVAGGLLCGCTDSPPPAPTAAHGPAARVGSDTTPTPTPTPVPLDDQFEYLPPANTVLATGSFQDVTGRASGAVTVRVASDLKLDVELTGFSTSDESGVTIALSVDRFGPSAGAPTVPAVDLPLGVVYGAGGDTAFRIDTEGRRDRGDLSYFNSLEVVHEGGTVVAAAPLTWTVPDFYPGLRLVDSGPADYARGRVTDYRGRPASYEVWGNDNPGAVARRFGITLNQLLYLNPQVRRDSGLERDTRLNLSVDYR